MKVTIDTNVLKEHNLSLTEFWFILFNINGGDIQECITSLVEKKIVSRDIFDDTKIVLSNNTLEEINNILVDSEAKPDQKENYNALADKLRELFPKGNKPGTTYQWRGSTAEIARKLKNLVIKYNCKFTEEEAINATKAYIASFNGDYKYMKLLKYFLLKTPRNNNGDIEVESEFMSYLDNKGTVEVYNNNWTIDLV